MAYVNIKIMTPQPAETPAERLFDLKDTQWATALMHSNDGMARMHFDLAQTSAEKLQQRAQANPNEYKTARALSEGRNLPAVREQLAQQVRIHIPRSREEKGVQSAFEASLEKQYPKDMRKEHYINRGFLDQGGASEQVYFQACSVAAMISLNEAATNVHARLVAKAVLAAQDRGDDKALAALKVGVEPSDPSSLTIPTALIQHRDDQKIATQALKVMEATKLYKLGVNRNYPMADSVPHLNTARAAFGALRENIQQLDAERQQPASKAMSRESVAQQGAAASRVTAGQTFVQSPSK
jgi:hypothetical protein